MIPKSLQQTLQEHGNSEIHQVQHVSGGSINQAAKVIFQNGDPLFIKWNRADLADMFQKEIRGLRLLRDHSGDLYIPEIIDSGVSTSENTSWLILEYIEEGRSDSNFFQTFGEALASLHGNTADRYGLDHNNYIGRLYQDNTSTDSWNRFFIDRRIEPQLNEAIKTGLLPSGIRKNAERLYKELESLIPNEPSSLLHGDLWSGNFMVSENARPVLIDPAVYYGHREMELAFTRLFGGFSNVFYESYQQKWPLEPGFHDRVDIYNLYPLLVHVNLFGASYTNQVTQILNRY